MALQLVRMKVIFSIVLFMLLATSYGVRGASGPTVKWVINTSDVYESITFGAGRMGGQTVWDVDGDGTNEVIFGTREGQSKRLWCADASGEVEWIFPPLDRDGLLGDPTSKPSLIDVNNDGVYELCFAGRGGRLYVLTGDGSIMWVWDNPNVGSDMYGPPQAYDVDGDGFVEFFITDDRGYLHRVDHDGQSVWDFPVSQGAIMAQPTIADIDQDGEYEVLFASLDHGLYCIDARKGLERWRFDAGAEMVGMPVVVADVNMDGEYEAVVCSDGTLNRSGAVFAINYVGSEVWRWELPRRGTEIRFAQAFGDVDGDGRLDMVVMSYIGVFCVQIGGDTPATKWEINLTRWSEEGILPEGACQSVWSSYQLIADIDGDDRLEVLLLGPFPIVVDGATGEFEAYYLNQHVAVGRSQENGAWWGDVDADGVSEWICELRGWSRPETQVYCLTLNGTFPARSPWPEYYHCAYPAEYQNSQDWLTLKGAYSNSLWFPLPAVHCQTIVALLVWAWLAEVQRKRNERDANGNGTRMTGARG